MHVPIVSIPNGLVPMRGFQWTTSTFGGRPSDRTLVPVDPGDVENQRVRVSRRTADEAVFLEFGSLNPGESEFLDFAKAYGPLFSGWDIFALLNLSTSDETFASWQSMHEQVAMLCRHLSGPPVYRWFGSQQSPVIDEVNRHLAVTPRLAEDRNPAKVSERLQLQLVPHNLAGAIWLRLAEAIAYDREFQRCQRCHRFMVLTHDKTGRSTKKYCSDTCRLGSYRTRQLEAIELANAGLTADVIAQRVSSTPETVQRWVASGGPNAIRRAREGRRHGG